MIRNVGPVARGTSMKKALVLVSMIAAISFAACSKKEETTTVTPAAPAATPAPAPAAVVVTPPAADAASAVGAANRLLPQRTRPLPPRAPPPRRDEVSRSTTEEKAALGRLFSCRRVRLPFSVAAQMSSDDASSADRDPAEAALRIGDDDVAAIACPRRRPACRARGRAGCSPGSGGLPPDGAGRRADRPRGSRPRCRSRGDRSARRCAPSATPGSARPPASRGRGCIRAAAHRSPAGCRPGAQ